MGLGWLEEGCCLTSRLSGPASTRRDEASAPAPAAQRRAVRWASKNDCADHYFLQVDAASSGCHSGAGRRGDLDSPTRVHRTDRRAPRALAQLWGRAVRHWRPRAVFLDARQAWFRNRPDLVLGSTAALAALVAMDDRTHLA